MAPVMGIESVASSQSEGLEEAASRDRLYAQVNLLDIKTLQRNAQRLDTAQSILGRCWQQPSEPHRPVAGTNWKCYQSDTLSSAFTMTTENKSSVKEDDLDELDDVLDQFDPKSPPPTRNPTLQPPTPASPSPLPVSSGRPRTNTRVDQLPKPTPGGGSLDATAEEDEITKAFTQELEKEMENLVKEFTQNMTPNPDKGSDSKNDSEESSKILKAAWEAMLVEGMDGLNAPTPDPASKPDSDKQAASSTNFQEKIQQTMEKLKQNDGGKASGSSSGNESDDIQKLLEAAMSGLGSEGGEGESEAELASFLENMMGQLMSKQVLYEPLKDLEEKFPPYLANPPSPISDQDRTRYDKQLVCIKKILAVFDKPDYDDKNASSSQAIVDLMSEMQSYGSPPSEVMGELPPGLGLGGEGMPEGCIIS